MGALFRGCVDSYVYARTGSGGKEIRAVILVHNALNPTLVRSFRRKAKDDEIYDIRFFTPDEVVELVQASGISYRRGSLPEIWWAFQPIVHREAGQAGCAQSRVAGASGRDSLDYIRLNRGQR